MVDRYIILPLEWGLCFGLNHALDFLCEVGRERESERVFIKDNL